MNTIANRGGAETIAVTILVALSFCHMLNDMMQSVLLAIYPMLKTSFQLNFAQIGLLTLGYQLTASVLQPAVGLYADHRPQPYALSVGMGFTLAGLVLLAVAGSFVMLLLASALVGIGSSIFHPESSRIARQASGGRHGFAQSFFQLGGNFGSALGPLLAAFIILPRGQASVAWLSFAAFLAILLLIKVGNWYRRIPSRQSNAGDPPHGHEQPGGLPAKKIVLALGVLMALVFSKYFYMTSLSSYYTFYLISKFNLSVQSAQVHLFIFLGAVAAGTIVGGPIGDRFGRKRVIWSSIVGVLPFTLPLPYANLFWTEILSALIGFIIASAFSAILVYAHELLPGKVGMISGLFFGLAFGIAGIGAAVLGYLADVTSIEFVYHICSFLPLLGLLTVFLPDPEMKLAGLKPHAA